MTHRLKTIAFKWLLPQYFGYVHIISTYILLEASLTTKKKIVISHHSYKINEKSVGVRYGCTYLRQSRAEINRKKRCNHNKAITFFLSVIWKKEITSDALYDTSTAVKIKNTSHASTVLIDLSSPNLSGVWFWPVEFEL